MAAPEDLKPAEDGKVDAVTVTITCREKVISQPEAVVTNGTEPEAETETETDEQGIDFVTLGMFIIGKLFCSCLFSSVAASIVPRMLPPFFCHCEWIVGSSPGRIRRHTATISNSIILKCPLAYSLSKLVKLQ